MDKIEITPELLADLKAKAEKATPEFVREGYFIYGPKHPCSQHPNGRIFITRIVEGSNRRDPNLDGGAWMTGSGTADAAYIAAANPQAILELIAAYERLEKENEELRANNYSPEILNDPAALTLSYFAGRMAEGREQNAKEDKLLDEKERLEKEADWLAEQLLCCIDDNRVDTCRYEDCRHLCSSLVTTEGWRKAAREAVEAQCKSN